jgi:hypothetical protein
VVAEVIELINLLPPFSLFDFIEERLKCNNNGIRRILSLSRSADAKTLIYEQIPIDGIIKEEVEDIKFSFPSYSCPSLIRISFWNQDIDQCSVNSQEGDSFLGYAILKKDVVPDITYDRWHVFEAVFRKYPHRHNCVPCPTEYSVTIGTSEYKIKGVLYCQQNELNKSCAQVALRSIISRHTPYGDVSYREINNIAKELGNTFDPCKGLSIPQIRKVLTAYDLDFQDIDYPAKTDLKKMLPYQKYVYSGLESGSGALLGFRLAGKNCKEERGHIIPIYGHTFNKDTWVPDAEISYFKIGEGVGYIPSESWTSSFLGHDDNFGPNFCIPRLYIDPDKVDYVVEVFRPGVKFSGLQAEALALNILYSILDNHLNIKNKWIQRLKQWTDIQQIILRAQALKKGEYVNHLRSLKDWEDNQENSQICDFFDEELPDFLWVVEISTPHLFPANQRKLGEIVFDATNKLETTEINSISEKFLFVRLPSIYLFGGESINNTPQFRTTLSNLISHTELAILSK